VDLRFSPEDQAFRADVRSWLEQNHPGPLPSGDTAEGFDAHRPWEQKLAEAKLSAVSWPEAYGGRGASLIQWLIFEEEYWQLECPQRITQNGIFLLAPTLFEFGTEAQKQQVLPAMARAETLWAQAWSEPAAGSDLASLRSKAERVEGGWRLSGQKTWCTRGAFCDAAFGPFRSDPNSERHRGLTYFLFPLQGEGVTVRPFGRLDGDDGFAEVFLDGLFVPDANVVGAVGEGWKVAMATTNTERGLSLRSPGRFLSTSQRLVELFRRLGRADQMGLRDAITRCWIRAQSYRATTYRFAARMDAGDNPGVESSLNKIFWSELDVEMHRLALELLETRAELTSGALAEEAGRWMDGYQFALAGPIYAGTNEIQRNIYAKRGLKLGGQR
jgi:alkylation response protein AidB-like acyl-CoA dehydrogenase